MSNVDYEVNYVSPRGDAYKTFFIAWAGLGIGLAVVLSHFLPGWFASSHVFVQYAHWLTWTVLFGLAYTVVPYVVFASCSQGQRLQVTKHGLGLPNSVGLWPGMNRWHAWPTVEMLSMTTNTPSAITESDYLLIKFKDATPVKLYLVGFNRKELSHLLLSLEVFAGHAVRSPELQSFQDNMHNTAGGDVTYTRIWEEALGRRFHSTTFIPMSPGQTLANRRLTVIRQLAFGGSSAVYLAKEQTGAEVVVKESVMGVDAVDALAQKAAEFFEREANLLLLLKHPSIARVLDHFVENNRQYLVLEYVPGLTLRQLVRKKGALPEKRVLELALQMVEILQYLHTHHPPVIHRDFTPDNLVLRPDGQLTLIDFGAANQFLGTATGTLVGKQCYMPPEQVRGQTTPLSDLYAMGCTISYLLTGADNEALHQAHPGKLNPNLNPGTEELVAKLTEQNKEKRFKTAQLAGMAVESILEELGSPVGSLLDGTDNGASASHAVIALKNGEAMPDVVPHDMKGRVS
jgi:tRNA A-37 threonylcarbamoyl transferase component Bud32